MHLARPVVAMLLVPLTLLSARHALAQTSSAAPAAAPPPHPCPTMPEARQFDFWIGTWDVTPWQVAQPSGQQKLGVNEVYPILEHCVISENWTGARGGMGKSYNFYDTNIRKWRQVWMADSGGPLDYTGELKDGAMRFQGWNLDAAGKRLEQRLTFFAIAADTVRQLFEQSADGGTTWTPTFDGRYVRRK